MQKQNGLIIYILGCTMLFNSCLWLTHSCLRLKVQYVYWETQRHDWIDTTKLQNAKILYENSGQTANEVCKTIWISK
jgi:hypothetical protein